MSLRLGLGAIHGYDASGINLQSTGMYPWERITGSTFCRYSFNILHISQKLSMKYFNVIRNIYMEFGITDHHIDTFCFNYRNFRWRWTVTYPYKVKCFYRRHRTKLWRYELKWRKRVNSVRTWWWRDVRHELLLKQRRPDHEDDETSVQ